MSDFTNPKPIDIRGNKIFSEGTIQIRNNFHKLLMPFDDVY